MPLTEEEKGFVRTYKFTGGDLSIIYQRVLTHWSQFCVDAFVPLWVAPNLLTVLGLIVSLVSVAITVYVHPSLGPGCPRWIGIMNGIAIFAYQTLDAMDGKQARKTGSSSALGMVFDHGCDAINAGVSVLSMGAVMGTGWTGKLFMPYLGAFLPFYVQTWEEYYTGSMIFPAFNGPTQGLLMAIAVCFLQSWIGNEAFHEELFKVPPTFLLHENIFTKEMGYPSIENPSVTPFTIMLVLITCCLIPTLFIHPYRVITERIKNNDDVWGPFFYLLPFLVILYCGFTYATFSRIAWSQFPLVTAVFYCCMFAEINIHIMTSHITHRPIDIPGRFLLWILVLLSALVHFDCSCLATYEPAVLLIGSIISLIFLLSEIHVIFSEYAEALNIYIFKLGKAKEE